MHILVHFYKSFAESGKFWHMLQLANLFFSYYGSKLFSLHKIKAKNRGHTYFRAGPRLAEKICSLLE